MANIICISNQIAGSGKTTTAVSLAASFALMEKKTLLIDCDPQAVATRWMGISDQDPALTIYDAFMGQVSLDKVIRKCHPEFLSILPSRIDLFQAEHKLAVKPGKEMILRKLTEKISSSYDVMIMDSPPTLGFFTVCAMAAADWVILPIPDPFQGRAPLNHMMDVIGMVQDELNPGLKFAGLLATRCNGNREFSPTMSGNGLRSGVTLFETRIPNDGMFREAYDQGRPIQLHNIMSEGARSYLNLSVELINLIDKK